MSSLTDFEKKHPAIGSTELWNLLAQRVKEEKLTSDFLTSVGKICDIGITLSKDIIRFFPKFTLHDETHIMNVCNWMVKLLGDRKKEANAHNLALLIMSACCHDVGMSVSDVQAEQLRSNPNSPNWKQYFKNHLKDEEEFSKTGIISDRMLRSYIRLNHHNRISQQITQSDWPDELIQNGINRNVLIDLCSSHGESLGTLNPARWQKYDLRFCAVILRLADILDFDSSRAPTSLFYHLGLDNALNFEEKISQTEWSKNRSGVFGDISDGVISYTASFKSLQLELEVQFYLEWVQKELDSSREYLSTYAGEWQNLALPQKISTESVERNGYHYGKFCLTMDQDRVLELLTGRNLYSDPGVFVRELLQNSIDAILTRSKLDPNFNENEGKIVIRTWMDNDGNSWFRIEDNGIGMDENIITNYFLKVGRSYYASDEFKADKRRYARGDDYTPISRFGIGVLSCFMSDPENNKLEVSTKRYSQDCMVYNSAIRMNVEGLHGYYYLAKEQEQDQYDEFFQSMHNPENELEGYRTQVGTTICVRVNLFQLGGYRGFKEILDKYVQFPEVNIEYHGPEGIYIYPTQNDLMQPVYKLNPNGIENAIKNHIHPLTDEQFEKIKSQLPETEWEEKPAIKLKYHPLDWLSKSENVKGVIVMVSLQAKANSLSFEYDGKTVSSNFVFDISNSPTQNGLYLSFKHEFPYDTKEDLELLASKDRKMHYRLNDLEERLLCDYKKFKNNDDWIDYISAHYSISKKEIHKKYKELRKIQLEVSKNRSIVNRYDQLTRQSKILITYDELFKVLSKEESIVLKNVMQAYKFLFTDLSRNSNVTTSAYNGVLADTSNLFGHDSQCLGAIMLLRGNYCPEVNLARDTISGLPLEAACNLSIVEHKLKKIYNFHRYSSESKTLEAEQQGLLSEETLYELLEKHPEWMSSLSDEDGSVEQLKAQLEDEDSIEITHFNKNSLFDYMRIAMLKHNFTLHKKFGFYSSPYITVQNKNITSNFPIPVFFSFEDSISLFGIVSNYYINYYNQEHRFSRWLINHKSELESKVPGIYNTLLETLIKSNNKSEIVEVVNNTLTRLKNYKSNFFKVSDELLLKSDELE